MGNDLEALAKSLADTANGGNAGISINKLMQIFATDSGKKVLASLLADGGARVKNAANSAKNGDLGGVRDIISSISSTKDGADVLSQITEATK